MEKILAITELVEETSQYSDYVPQNVANFAAESRQLLLIIFIVGFFFAIASAFLMYKGNKAKLANDIEVAKIKAGSNQRTPAKNTASKAVPSYSNHADNEIDDSIIYIINNNKLSDSEKIAVIQKFLEK